MLLHRLGAISAAIHEITVDYPSGGVVNERSAMSAFRISAGSHRHHRWKRVGLYRLAADVQVSCQVTKGERTAPSSALLTRQGMRAAQRHPSSATPSMADRSGSRLRWETIGRPLAARRSCLTTPGILEDHFRE
jgi:hypothetical protein